uniref:phosphopyruvate hydratase n=1 Tax=Helianthus annuus TaxID=4232 RepID=A0A251UAC5_HELAN
MFVVIKKIYDHNATNVGDEGGFAPNIKGSRETMDELDGNTSSIYSLLDTWMYVLEDFGSERSALAKDKIYTHINLKQMTIIREAEAGLMDCKLDIIMSLHPLMQYIPLFILKWQGLQKKVIFVTDTTTGPHFP